MKTRLGILLSLLFCWACEDNADYSFQGRDAVYFQISDDWKKTVDSVYYTFAGKSVDTDVIMLRVNLEGNTSSVERKVCIRVNDIKTDAEEGVHYKALEDVYYLPADSIYLQIPITLYNKDHTLENRKVTLALCLEPTEDLGLGVTERTEIRVLISDMLKKPSYWDTVIKYDFGIYSREKHERCIQILGIDFPETSAEYYENTTYWDVSGKYMSSYFEENYPIYDENGTIIEPW